MFSRLFNGVVLVSKALLIFVIVQISSVAAKEPVILVVGDSISAAFGMSMQAGWVSLMEKRLQQQIPQLTVINASISGDTTAGGLKRLPALLEQHQPTRTLIELGGNDGLRGMPINRIKANLQNMIAMAQAANSEVLLLGMQIPPNYGPRYTEMFRDIYTDLAQENEVDLVPFLLEGVAERKELMQDDGIHPTAEAQPIILEQVLPFINP